MVTVTVAKEDLADNKLLSLLLRPLSLNSTLVPTLVVVQVAVKNTEQVPRREEASATIIRMATVEEEHHADFYT